MTRVMLSISAMASKGAMQGREVESGCLRYEDERAEIRCPAIGKLCRVNGLYQVHDLGAVEAELECVRASCEAHMKFPVGDVVGLDRRPRLVFGCIVLL